MSLMPGAAVATTSRAPGRHQPLGDPRQAVVVEVLEQRLVGREGAGPHLALARRSAAGDSTASS